MCVNFEFKIHITELFVEIKSNIFFGGFFSCEQKKLLLFQCDYIYFIEKFFDFLQNNRKSNKNYIPELFKSSGL